MVNRLLVLSLIIVAALSSSTPARASTLTVSIQCVYEGNYSFTCNATPTGGTGTYTNYKWTVNLTGWPGQVGDWTTAPTFSYLCLSIKSVEVVVRDSAGAWAVASTPFNCYS